MEKRINITEVEPGVINVIMSFEKYMASTALSPIHKELIKIRASQINGCAYCINKHTVDARKLGETEQRIYLLNAWRETDLYTEEEQAILALTEEVTMISNHVSDATYKKAASLFSEQYLAQLIMAIISINSLNRIGIATGMRVS